MSERQEDFYSVDGYKIPKLPPLSNEETIELIKQYKNGDMEAGKKVIEHNYGLVIKYCYQVKNPHVTKLELFQEGCIGLMKALDIFEIEKGYKYSTIAVWWIKQRIFHYCTKNSYELDVGQRIYQLIYKIRHFESLLSNKLGRQPTLEELSEELGVSVDKTIEALLLCAGSDSLDRNISDGDNSESSIKLLDVVPGVIDDPEEVFFEKNKREAIIEIIDETCKNDLEKRIIFGRFGFNADEGVKTLKQLGIENNISSERVRQIEAKVLKKMKKNYSKQLEALL